MTRLALRRFATVSFDGFREAASPFTNDPFKILGITQCGGQQNGHSLLSVHHQGITRLCGCGCSATSSPEWLSPIHYTKHRQDPVCERMRELISLSLRTRIQHVALKRCGSASCRRPQGCQNPLAQLRGYIHAVRPLHTLLKPAWT